MSYVSPFQELPQLIEGRIDYFEPSFEAMIRSGVSQTAASVLSRSPNIEHFLEAFFFLPPIKVIQNFIVTWIGIIKNLKHQPNHAEDTNFSGGCYVASRERERSIYKNSHSIVVHTDSHHMLCIKRRRKLIVHSIRGEKGLIMV